MKKTLKLKCTFNIDKNQMFNELVLKETNPFHIIYKVYEKVFGKKPYVTIKNKDQSIQGSMSVNYAEYYIDLSVDNDKLNHEFCTILDKELRRKEMIYQAELLV